MKGPSGNRCDVLTRQKLGQAAHKFFMRVLGPESKVRVLASVDLPHGWGRVKKPTLQVPYALLSLSWSRSLAMCRRISTSLTRNL